MDLLRKKLDSLLSIQRVDAYGISGMVKNIIQFHIRVEPATYPRHFEDVDPLLESFSGNPVP